MSPLCLNRKAASLCFIAILTFLTCKVNYGQALPLKAELPGTKYSSIENYIENNQERQSEKIYLHVDRRFFSQTDTIWFKVYCWSGYEQLPDTVSEIIYVDLIDKDGKVVSGRRIQSKNGISNGDMMLNKNIYPGIYTLRSYTRRMYEAGTYEPFYQNITITASVKNFSFESNQVILKHNTNDSLRINFRFSEADSNGVINNNLHHYIKYLITTGNKTVRNDSILAKNTIDNSFVISLAGLSKTDSAAQISFSIREGKLNYEKLFMAPLRDNIDLQFFPEGGNLIAGFQNKVAFKAIGVDGLKRDVQGTIIDNYDNTVCEFKSSCNGMGYLTFKPEASKRYSAILLFNKVKYIIPLPQVKEKGVVMSVENSVSSYDPVVHLKQTPGFGSTDKYLVGSSYGNIWFSAKIKSLNDSCVMKVPSSILPEGICRLTLLSESFVPECERLIYIDKKERLKINLSSDSTSYEKRSKVILTIKTTDLENNPVSSNLSVSVLDNELTSGQANSYGIRSYKLILSELKGNIEDIDSLIKDDGSINYDKMELLLLTQGYRSFNPENIQKSSEVSPETNIKIAGRIRLKCSDKQANKFDYSQVNLDLMTVSKNPFAAYTNPDSSGNFIFEMPLLNGKPSIVVAATKGRKKPFDSEISINQQINPLRFKTRPVISEKNTFQIIESGIGNQPKSDFDMSKFKLPGIMSKKLGEVVVTAKSEPKTWYRIKDEYASKIVNLDSIDPTGKKYRGFYEMLVQDFGALWCRGTEIPVNTILMPAMNMLCPTCSHWMTPIYLIDGKVYRYSEPDFSELNSLGAFPVNEIKRILVIPAGANIISHYDDGLSAHGVYPTMIVIETYSKNTYRGDLPGVKKFILEGLDEPRSFYSPKYEGQNKNIPEPDFRKTLYWNPAVVTDSTGIAKVEFYTSDRRSQLDVIIKGIQSISGNPGDCSGVIRLR
jgi:hypothetical protein